ncbi:hypothetical protein AB0465_37485 [Streptomyces griseoviridis]|uniref:hypothetical protein n=1 Tax=Streptomyces griseoviridis TaxID=45398 RepID=UPI0033C4B2BD
MSHQQLTIVAVLGSVLVWSVVMTVLGQLAAAAALLPSLGLLIQQITAALGPRTPPGVPLATAPHGSEGPAR